MVNNSSPDVFLEFLRYIYTDEVTVLEADKIVSLLDLCDYYQLSSQYEHPLYATQLLSIFLRLEHILATSLTKQNFSTFFEVATNKPYSSQFAFLKGTAYTKAHPDRQQINSSTFILTTGIKSTSLRFRAMINIISLIPSRRKFPKAVGRSYKHNQLLTKTEAGFPERKMNFFLIH